MPTCPHCKKENTRLEFEKFVATEGQGAHLNPSAPKLRAVAYFCHHCGVILGVGLDPAKPSEKLASAQTVGQGAARLLRCAAALWVTRPPATAQKAITAVLHGSGRPAFSR